MGTFIQNRRLLLSFLFGIGLPCVLLGLLALRGIRNDQALLEKQKLLQNRIVVARIGLAIDSLFAAAEQDAATFLNEKPQEVDAPAKARFGAFEAQHPEIAALFFFSKERVTFPWAKLCYLPEHALLRSQIKRPAVPGHPVLANALDLEFVRYDLHKALEVLLQLQSSSLSEADRIEAGFALARVQKKLGRFSEAQVTFEELTSQFTGRYFGEHLPIQLVATLEQARLSSREAAESSLKKVVQIYSNLISGHFSLERGAYLFYAKMLEQEAEVLLRAVGDSLVSKTFFQQMDSLQQQRSRSEHRTDLLYALQQTIGEAPEFLEAAVSLGDWRVTKGTTTQTFLISILPAYIKKTPGGVSGWGILYNAPALSTTLLRRIIQPRFNSGEAWQVLSTDGERLTASTAEIAGEPLIQTSFPANFPPWFLQLYPSDTPQKGRLSNSKTGVYSYIFILTGVILCFGFIVTLLSFRKESELGKMKSNFIASVTHELKSPLTAIRQLGEMLQSGRVPSMARQRQYLDAIVEQSDRLDLLISNILDFSKIEQSRMFRFEMLNLVSFLQEIVSRWQQQVHHTGFEIHAQIAVDLPFIKADRAALEQAINNLIDNAVKFSNLKKHVEIFAHCDTSEVVIRICDHGIGIPEDEKDKIFQQFFRGRMAIEKNVRGTGIGLALVRQIALAHHGRLEVESAVAMGTCFSIFLPLPHAQSPVD